jgi:nicotinamidase-related amidase
LVKFDYFHRIKKDRKEENTIMAKNDVALILLDLQNEAVDERGLFSQGGLFGDQGIAKEVARKGLLPKIRAVLDKARAADATIIHVGTRYRPGYPELKRGHPVFDQIKDLNSYLEGGWGAEFHKDIAPQGDEIVVWKHKVSAFYQTDLHIILTALNIQTIIAVGVALNNVVESTARDAADRGFDFAVVRDCCASFDGEQDDFAAVRVLPRFCRVVESDQVAKILGI